MTIRKYSVVLRDLLLEKRTKKNRQEQHFWFVGCNLFVVTLSVRIFALFDSATLWEILHVPLPMHVYGLNGIVVE